MKNKLFFGILFTGIGLFLGIIIHLAWTNYDRNQNLALHSEAPRKIAQSNQIVEIPTYNIGFYDINGTEYSKSNIGATCDGEKPISITHYKDGKFLYVCVTRR